MSDFLCPKCGGVDYYLSNRTVMKGIGGIWGNKGGVKKFPVCRVCEEIMDSTKPAAEKFVFKYLRFLVIFFILYFAIILLFL